MYGKFDIYTISFFGHRQIDNFYKVESEVEKYVHQFLAEKEYVDFLIGRDGEFDFIVSTCIKRQKKTLGDCNSSLVWVMPYLKAEYENNADNFDDYYDEVEVCEASSMAHYKAAIQIRNRNMVDRSDLVIFYVENKKGGAYQTMKYAEKQGKSIINLADEIE